MRPGLPILIAAINARHSHATMGARCLLANLGPLRSGAALVEFTLRHTAGEMVEVLVLHQPRILALGVYIWNARLVAELLPLLRKALPAATIVLGGPELTDAWTGADYRVMGEGDRAFADLCREILAGHPPTSRVLRPPPPDMEKLRLPYDEYTAEDVRNRLIYVESSRGCAMHCDYCTSAGQGPVRFFPMPVLREALCGLVRRGARHFKFCDRSFNLDIARAIGLLEFFLEMHEGHPDIFVHLEMLPDRFPSELREVLARFPDRALQLEIGIQSLTPAVLATIHRAQHLERALENLRYLRGHTRAWLHVDLIAGLPGETPESFAAGFDLLAGLEPHEIQVGILKKLPGTRLARHDAPFEMVYEAHPPYAVVSTRDWPAGHLARTARFAHNWDAIVNSNRFLGAAPLIWRGASSVFDAFMAFSDWMGERFPTGHGIPLSRLVEAVFAYLVQVRRQPPEDAARALICAYRHSGARDIPEALAPHLRGELPAPSRHLSKPLRRQSLRWSWPGASL